MLAASELILNADGSIYHLCLKPEEIADLIITVGDPERVGMVSRHFDRIDVQRSHREFVTHTGYIGNKRLTVIATGIGTDNIDIVLNELDALANIDFEKRQPRAQHRQLEIVRIGTSGALQAQLAPDTFLASTSAFGLDSLLHFYGAARHEEAQHLTNYLQHPAYYAKADDFLLEKFLQINLFQTGITLTAPGFYAPQGRTLRAQANDNGFLKKIIAYRTAKGEPLGNMEMETAGIYGLSQVLGHKAISLNALLANRANGAFSTAPSQAVEKLIAHVLAILCV